MTITSPITQDRVDLVDGTLYIRDLVETDAEVLRVVGDADDPVEPTRQCLRIGARAILAVNATVDTHIVEKRFDAMSDADRRAARRDGRAGSPPRPSRSSPRTAAR